MKSQDVPIWAIYQNRGKYENYEDYQRQGSVWPRIMNQALINTILFGGIVPPIIALRKTVDHAGMVYYIIDGRQRLTAIFGFLDGKFKTVSRHKWHIHEPGIEPIEPSKSFDQLSSRSQDFFKDFTLTIYSSEDMNKLTASFLFRQVNKHVNLVRAERLNSYQSVFLHYAHALLEHPFWKEIYKGKDNRRQILRGCLYILAMQVKKTYVAMSSISTGIFASGSLDAELSDETFSECSAKLGQIMHVFAGCSIQQSYELIPMYQAIQFLEKEDFSFDFVASGIFTNWYRELQHEALRMKYNNRAVSLFLQMENLSYQEEFWQKHLPTLRAILKKTLLHI